MTRSELVQPSGRPVSRTTSFAAQQPVGKVDVVSFDLRRNLIKILGEDHYPYAEFLYHELAANAWDEDATEVQIVENVIAPARRGQPAVLDIVVRDNGNGMDLGLLREYFKVGESGKRARKVSERLGRPLIGQIGVGKVSILKAARRWQVTTERHLGLDEPVRLTVHVDIDQWIDGDLPAFAVQYLEPTGSSGTEITLEGVTVKMREDRIVRHLQRLPLGEDFMVWRNGDLIPPKQWFGVDMIPIDTEVEWVIGGETEHGRLRGELWIRPEAPSKREQAYIKEPADSGQGLRRDAAGIEVRVNQDMITREFFGHESHGHQVNRIWGWVEAPWLPILGNRTDYLRDHPAGVAFFDAVKPYFDDAYRRVRYEQDSRAQEAKRKADGAGGDEADGSTSPDEASADGAGAAAAQQSGASTLRDTVESEHEQVASRYGETLKRTLDDHPDLAPVLREPARTSRGRPALDRIYPARPTGERQAFVADPYGTDFAIRSSVESDAVSKVVAGSALRSGGDGAERDDDVETLETAEVVRNTPAGIRLRFVPLGGFEAPYRWALGDSPELSLDINTDHKLYVQSIDRPGGAQHRLYCSLMISLALGELAHPSTGPAVAAYVETLAYELFDGTAGRRRG
jgi:hypothetical protein